jgi:hypothetical protein
LASGEWVLKGETEELGEETHLFIAVRKLGGYVFQGEGRFVFEDCGPR